jgi:hypothetical protein
MRLLQKIHRCPYCKRENKVSASSFAENPFCNQCLNERLEKASLGAGPFEIVSDGHYIRRVPIEYMI